MRKWGARISHIWCQRRPFLAVTESVTYLRDLKKGDMVVGRFPKLQWGELWANNHCFVTPLLPTREPKTSALYTCFISYSPVSRISPLFVKISYILSYIPYQKEGKLHICFLLYVLELILLIIYYALWI